MTRHLEPSALFIVDRHKVVRSAPLAPVRWPKSIPKHIHITVPDTLCRQRPMNKYCAYMGSDPVDFLRRIWLQLNPDFELTVHNDSDCDAFMRSLQGNVHAAYLRVPHPSIRADLWRVAYLREYGGVYVDADVEPVARLRTIVRPDDIFVTSGSRYPDQTNFHIIVSPPREPALDATFQTMTRVFRTTKYTYWGWSGCKMMYNALIALRKRNRIANEDASRFDASRITHTAADGLGEGFRTASGNYRLLSEGLIGNWRSKRKVTYERLPEDSSLPELRNPPHGARGAMLRVLLLNKYLYLPNASCAESTRQTHWGPSVDLWAPPGNNTQWMLHQDAPSP